MCRNAIKVCLLQHGTESNSGAIYRSNPVRFIFTFRLFFFKLGKKEDILDWEWGLISDPGDREERPCNHNTSITSGELVQCSKHIAQPSLAAVNQILCN